MTGGWAGIIGCCALLKASAKNSRKMGLRIAKINQSGDNSTIMRQRKKTTSKVHP